LLLWFIFSFNVVLGHLERLFVWDDNASFLLLLLFCWWEGLFGFYFDLWQTAVIVQGSGLDFVLVCQFV
jgi:hypothetical protein